MYYIYCKQRSHYPIKKREESSYWEEEEKEQNTESTEYPDDGTL